MSSSKQYRHWKPETDSEGILWLHIDQEDSNANVLCVSVLEELESLLDDIMSGSLPLGIVFISDKKNGFIAGADIEEFTKIKDEESALKHIRRGQEIMDKIAALQCPTVALIHGFCMGGGMELALACRYRIADDNLKTVLSLPEVQLGIHPGFGGSVRLPPLVGAPAAMDIMLTGKPVKAKVAQKLGMIDFAVATRHLKSAAHQIIVERPKTRELPFLKRITNHSLVRPFLAKAMRKQVARKARKDHYPAPYALINLWAKYMDNPKAMMVQEAKSVARLVIGDTAQNLVRVFFLRERLKSLGKVDKAAPKIGHVHVIGAGVMGGDIAAWCALKGLDVTLQDRSQEIIAKAFARAHKLFSKKLREPRLVAATMDRLVADVHGRGVPKADIIIEAIIENIEAKQGLYRELEPRMKEGALLTTNTSSIPLEILGEALEKPERLVGLHFFNPVAQMPLIEIVTAEKTDHKSAERVSAFATQISKLPLPVKSAPGFLVNRILMPYMMEAVRLREEGVPPLVIDNSALAFGMPMGPLFLADTVGLDICASVAGILSRELGLEVPETLTQMVEKGNLGAKSGQGFYHYTKGKRDKLKDENMSPSAEVTDRLIGRMINEAVACLREGVVADEELLDAGVIFGTGFAPFRGGPMNFVYHQGVGNFLDKLNNLEQRHGNLFHADDGWTSLAT